MKNIESPINHIIKPDTWQKRYEVHKYWGKKPSNVIAEYINYFTNEGDTILDVFSGFGVTTIEAVVNNRVGIGVDINPISKYICESMLKYVDLKEFKDEYKKMELELTNDMEWLYSTKCPNCSEPCKIVSTIWEDNAPIEIKYLCKHCKAKGIKSLDELDLEKIKEINNTKIKYWYPKDKVFEGWETKKLKKAGIQDFSDIYSKRNLYALSSIFNYIVNIDNKTIREIFIVTFTSMIAQASKMIANYKGNSGGPSWKINTYWLPKSWQELNAWHYFGNRYKKMLKGKEETNRLIGDNNNYKFLLKSSSNLSNEIKNNSVDYIFTDPPYGGEGIQYLELSFIWNSWLRYFNEKIDWSNEVVFNPYREGNFDEKHYEIKLTEVFKEAYRVLKDGAWMTVTFANKDLKIWNSIIRAFKNSGFHLINIVPMEASAPNITQMLLKETPKTDLIINVRKLINKPTNQTVFNDFNFNIKLEEIADNHIDRNGRVSLNTLFDDLLIEWFTIKYSHENFDAQLVDFDKRMITDYMNNSKLHSLYDCTETNELRKKADIEWTTSSKS
ncbi:hypothetical protein K9O30_13700 [Clostridium bowmanii]|uniref:DNA methyltransferase n=1 Tax=Clostridium bowmanii TaxID=132925 RepID=UPI001C0DFCEA|nr:DNA methyltransferase [Clostridium bowmanii]MBU3190158.1 hypothetical protein [Clostridium bowmanii]MCA1074754.1 hypothetical protein [Clostridium bowmanii]